MKWASLAKAQNEISVIRFRVIYLMVGMGCLSTRWWMYYRGKRSWLAGLIWSDSPLAQNPKLVGLQIVASDFRVDVVFPLPPDTWILVDTLLTSHSPVSDWVCWRHAKGYTQRAAFWEAGCSSVDIHVESEENLKEPSCNWGWMTDTVRLTQVPTKSFILSFYRAQCHGVCFPCFLYSGGWMFSWDFLGRKQGKHLAA